MRAALSTIGFQKRAHAINGLEDVVQAVGIGKANIALAMNAEVRAANCGDAGLFQKGVRKVPWP